MDDAESRSFMPHNTTDNRPAESKVLKPSVVNLSQRIHGIRNDISVEGVKKYTMTVNITLPHFPIAKERQRLIFHFFFLEQQVKHHLPQDDNTVH